MADQIDGIRQAGAADARHQPPRRNPLRAGIRASLDDRDRKARPLAAGAEQRQAIAAPRQQMAGMRQQQFMMHGEVGAQRRCQCAGQMATWHERSPCQVANQGGGEALYVSSCLTDPSRRSIIRQGWRSVERAEHRHRGRANKQQPLVRACHERSIETSDQPPDHARDHRARARHGGVRPQRPRRAQGDPDLDAG